MENVSTAEPVVNSREEWLRERRKGLGGSDAAAAVGHSPFKTALQLYYEKTGLYTPEDISDKAAVRFGNLVEDLVAEEFARITGKAVRRVNQILRHADHRWMLANLDRKIVGERALLEVKTTNGFTFKDEWGKPGTDEIPVHYALQCLHYLAVTGYDRADVIVLVDREFHLFHIERDDEKIGQLVEAEASFWERVELGAPPPADFQHPAFLPFVKRLHPGTDGSVVHLSDYDLKLKARYDELKKTIEEAEKERASIQARWLHAMGDASAAVLPDGTGFRRAVYPEKVIRYTRKEYVDFRAVKTPMKYAAAEAPELELKTAEAPL